MLSRVRHELFVFTPALPLSVAACYSSLPKLLPPTKSLPSWPCHPIQHLTKLLWKTFLHSAPLCLSIPPCLSAASVLSSTTLFSQHSNNLSSSSLMSLNVCFSNTCTTLTRVFDKIQILGHHHPPTHIHTANKNYLKCNI